jgi:serine/threonine protein kinase
MTFNKKRDRPSLTQQEIRADQELAKEFFKNNPGERFCGVKDGRIFSYFKSTNGEIFRRVEQLGQGAFGRTKLAVNIVSGQKVALKRQTPRSFDLTSLQEEAAINLDLGVAVTPLEIRKKNGSVYKVYQGMKNLGRPMDKYLENEGRSAPLEKRLEYSIQLLLRVHDLHTGAASKLRKPYAHCDIKPANICLDESGRIHLIDFGLTRDSNLSAKHTVVSGTPAYLPRNIKAGTAWSKNPYLETPSYFFDDKIAVLRSIFHPESTILKGFLTKPQFDSLPRFIKDVLISDDIKTCITKNYSLLSIAAVLSLYRFNRSCTNEEVAKILGSIEESKKHIARFQLYNDWVFYLKHDSALFSVDFSVLDQEKKNILSQAFNETLEPINKKNVKLLREKGIINDEQIRSKPQYRYDLEISPLKDNIQYWKAICKRLISHI